MRLWNEIVIRGENWVRWYRLEYKRKEIESEWEEYDGFRFHESYLFRIVKWIRHPSFIEMGEVYFSKETK